MNSTEELAKYLESNKSTQGYLKGNPKKFTVAISRKFDGFLVTEDNFEFEKGKPVELIFLEMSSGKPKFKLVESKPFIREHFLNSLIPLSVGALVDAEIFKSFNGGFTLRLSGDHRIMGVCYFQKMPKKEFLIGDKVKAKIEFLDEFKNKIEFSIQLDGAKIGWNDIQVGSKYKALVDNVKKDTYLLLKLKHNQSIKGICYSNEICDSQNSTKAQNILNQFEVGDYVKVYVLSVDPFNKKMSLSIKPSYFTKEDEEPFDSDEEEVQVETKQESMVDEQSKKRKHDDQSSSKQKETEKKKIKNDLSSESEDLEDESDQEENVGISGGGFSFGSSDFTYNKDDSAEENNQLEDVGDDDDDEQNEQLYVDKNLSKKKRKEKKKEKEMEIREIEKRFAEGKTKMESSQDFERILISSPNSSLIWIKYMAFQLHLSEIDKAREIAERALKRIDFREENEKLNVWIAYLNLEHKFGTESSLHDVFTRASSFNEPISVHMELANIHIRSGELQKAEELFKKMLKKFKKHSTVWTNYALFLLKDKKDLEQAKLLMDRSLQVLDKNKHVITLSNFAMLYFQHGSIDTGRTIFESILNNFPKRIDILSVYIGQEKKLGEFDRVRSLYERAINMKLSIKQMKFFFKNYLKFEQEHGTEENVENVKQKAYQYVNS